MPVNELKESVLRSKRIAERAKEGTHACESSKPMRERKFCRNRDGHRRKDALECELACATVKNRD